VTYRATILHQRPKGFIFIPIAFIWLTNSSSLEYNKSLISDAENLFGLLPIIIGKVPRNSQRTSSSLDMPVESSQVVDSFARNINYFRVSLTDQCNLRCHYCTPRPLSDKLPLHELLSYEELLKILRVAVGLGVRKVRLTGGEPLLRKDVEMFISRLLQIPGLRDVRLTTNGTFLAEKAGALHRAGVRKVNVSIDSLRAERFRQITGADLLAQVWRGVEQALNLGFEQIKLNMVVMRGINDDELDDFADLGRNLPIQVRFIEFMPIGADTGWGPERYLPAAEIMRTLARSGPLEPVESGTLDGPAKIYRRPGNLGTLGFISPISEHFCSRCNRLRLTAQGRLRSCLLSDQETDLKAVIRGGGAESDIRDVLLETIRNKPERHRLLEKPGFNCHGRMSRIGG
jgi:cyclic pyranopterin phosphate synthase